nr:saccharopine dehydrogenase NADP-binding domain-containing protein [Candidatus Sigynarchaeota archaeon]
MKKILVLGAYGHAGRYIVKGLAKHVNATIVATGRDKAKLDACFAAMHSTNLTTEILDAFEMPSLSRACEPADLVINCVGPYARNGDRITKVVIDAGKDYIDFANEQSHFRCLQALDARAKERNLSMVTAVGTSPGLSTLLFLVAREKLPDVSSLEMYYASGSKSEPHEAFGSVMGAIVETGFEPVEFTDGSYVKTFLGKDKKFEPMPAPFGNTYVIAFPTIDALVIPKLCPVKNVRSYWAMGAIPPGFTTIIKLLKPHRKDWSYNLVSKIVKASMKADHKKAKSQGLGLESVIKIVAIAGTRRWEALMTFPDGGGAAASYLPVITAKKIVEGAITGKGLLTPIDIIKPSDLIGAARDAGWNGTYTEANV